MNELIEYLEEYLETNSYNEHAALLTRTTLEMIVDSLKKTDKYRWHDLEKDATDLPETKDNVTVEIIKKMHGGGHYYEIVDYHYAAGWRAGHIISSQYIVAWRYIEPFESEVEDERKEETP